MTNISKTRAKRLKIARVCCIMEKANKSNKRRGCAPEKRGMRMAKETQFVEQIADIEKDFPQWYTDVV